jgi:hypothetical protein
MTSNTKRQSPVLGAENCNDNYLMDRQAQFRPSACQSVKGLVLTPISLRVVVRGRLTGAVRHHEDGILTEVYWVIVVNFGGCITMD